MLAVKSKNSLTGAPKYVARFWSLSISGKRRMLSISSKRENNVSPTYSEWCSFNSYVGWLQHCDSFRLYQKYVEPNVEYMHNYYLKEVKGNAEICKRKNYSGERKAS